MLYQQAIATQWEVLLHPATAVPARPQHYNRQQVSDSLLSADAADGVVLQYTGDKYAMEYFQHESQALLLSSTTRTPNSS